MFRQSFPESERHAGDEDGCHAVEGAPTERIGDEAGERPRQQRADHQTAHHVADDPTALGVAGERSPAAALGTAWHALTAHPALLAEALVLAAGAAWLPVRRRAIAPFGLLLLAGMVAADPAISDFAIVVPVAVTCLGLAARAES
jgi:hypothetical protein